MMMLALGTALCGAASFPHAHAFAPSAMLSSAASNAFVSRRGFVSSSTESVEKRLTQAAAAAGNAAARSTAAATQRRRRQQQGGGGGGGSGGGMVMLFDFIKKRAQEGVEQTQNLVTAAQTGRLDEALKETSAYVKDRNAKFSDGLAQSRLRFVGDLENLFGMAGPLEETLEKLEEALLQADLGATTSFQIIEDLRNTAKAEDRRLEPDDIKSVLRATLIQVLNGGTMPSAEGGGDTAAITFADPSLGVPSVLFFMGANGMGKTTTVGKVASRLREDGGQKVLLAAADTFRAAAVEQLNEWAERSGADIVVPLDKDERPPSVVARAAEKAVSEGYDVLIVDTSGRLSNNYSLNEELKDMKKALSDRIPGAPHDTLLVVDASVGRNAVDQARTWKQEVGISALVVTKLDGTARGGFVVSIVSDLGVPVKLIGVGESLYDLRDFEPVLFVDSLLGYSPEDASRLQAIFEANPVMQARMLERMKKAQQAAEPYVPPKLESYVEPASKSRRKTKASKGGKRTKRKKR
ncbi:PFtsY, plastid signal recognition particle receptor [Ectocarpus siliculosus]|uniref:PFtsY, plastid signal recognition particle receptor n=1 Tax=Ectocarpus siliculosus TaxID=2880 RepID=D7FVJ7_ECTSI|nr:PFtsY, plastid signal recognition particle receptor [Ectocarpus siliculosus]|eukprot:CBJ31918.1 PFtsY, plastid signal recognition particle receptor [Ectocarpus siliculosus]